MSKYTTEMAPERVWLQMSPDVRVEYVRADLVSPMIPATAADPAGAYFYARDVSTGEPAIARDPYYKDRYEALFEVSIH